jgi:histidyl-tRNA synthetase
MTLRAVKGMNDILPDEVGRWQHLESVLRRRIELHGYAEIRTPVLESTELFVRSLGETTEVVEKQMFVLERGGESLALRPEGTAPVVRAFVSHSLHAKAPINKLYYLGPMFRAEQPQRGRYRQFHQAGCELTGDPGPGCDAEMIDMLVGMLRELGIESFRVLVNSLGGAGTRARFRDALAAHLTPRAAELSEHSQKRLLDNPLRILDSKDPRDQRAVADAPSILDLLEPDDLAHWDGLRRALDALGTPYEVDAKLVRGLDYYTRTLFEIQGAGGELGTQNALLGGGRYDGMIEELGGPSVPAVGFAMGLERILLAMREQRPPARPLCFVAPIGERATYEALRVGRDLREHGIVAEVDTRGGKLKNLIRRADSLGARLCVVIGDTELDRGIVLLKDLMAHSQEEVARGDIARRALAVLETAPATPEGHA